jgi:hypothetical protein
MKAHSKRVWTVQPHEVVHQAAMYDKGAFIDLFGETLLLLVRLDDVTGDLGMGLNAAMGAAGDDLRERDVEPMPYETRSSLMETVPSSRFRQKEPFSHFALRARFDRSPYFVVPIRKRPGEKSFFTQRVSVGRARNNDVVLRDDSVSKFHGWFEIHEDHQLYVSDARSSNGTRVNADALAREVVPVSEGDVIDFGSVHTVVSGAHTLWEALH